MVPIGLTNQYSRRKLFVLASVSGMAFAVSLHAERIFEYPLQFFASFLAPLISIFFVFLFGATSLIPASVFSFVVRQSVYEDIDTVAMLSTRDLLIGLAAALAIRLLSKRKTFGIDLDDRVFHSVLKAIPDVLLIFNRNGKCVRIFQSGEDPNSWPTDKIVGKHIGDFLPAKEAERSLEAIQRVFDLKTPSTLDSVVLQIDDVTKYFTVRMVPINLQGRTAVLWSSRDVTEFKETQIRHRDSDELLRNLLRLQERERKLISCEIHDGVLQQIIVSHMMAQLVETKVADYNDDDISENLSTLKLTLSEAIDEGRNLIQELRPIMVDEQNVVDAIGYLVKEESNRGLMHLDFESDGDFDDLSPLLEGNIFRITQEALTNARRHSKAKLVEVNIRQVSNSIWLKISDDGVGFDANCINETSFGLKSIARRAQLFGGEAKIQSCPGEGTHIQVQLPIEGANQAIAN